MASAVVGVLLMTAVTFTMFASLVAFATTDHWTKNECEFHRNEETEVCYASWEVTAWHYRAKCRCDPPLVDDHPCQPVTLYGEFGRYWVCDLKPQASEAGKRVL